MTSVLFDRHSNYYVPDKEEEETELRRILGPKREEATGE
jgi:hypothetical protein